MVNEQGSETNPPTNFPCSKGKSTELSHYNISTINIIGSPNEPRTTRSQFNRNETEEIVNEQVSKANPQTNAPCSRGKSPEPSHNNISPINIIGSPNEPRKTRSQVNYKPERDSSLTALLSQSLGQENNMSEIQDSSAPECYKDIARRHDAQQWYQATESEIQGLI